MPDVCFIVLNWLCLGVIGEGQLDVHYPFKKQFCYNFCPFQSVSSSFHSLAWECFLSTNLSRVSLSMGGQFSLKLGVCDRIVYLFFFFLVCFDSFLSLCSASTSKELKALAAAFVVKARTLGFYVSSSLCCSLFALAVSRVMSEKHLLSNLIHHLGGNIQ